MSSEDSYLDLEGSDDEDSHQILSTHEGSSQMDKNPSTISNKTEDGSDKSATTPSGPAICGFCHKPSTLKIGGKSYLCNSRTMPHLRICNACKSYEYRHGILIDRDQRKNKSRKRRIDGDGPSRKRQYYDPVEENPQEIESEPELYPFARTDTPAKKIRTLPKPPAALRIPVFEASPKERNCLDPRLAKIEKDFGYPQEPKKELVSFAIEDHMDIEGDSDNDDLGCEQCKKPITSVSQLIMCGGCDKIFHKDCYALARSDYTILRSNSYGFRCLTISCADHEFTKRIRKEKPRSLPPLTIVDTKEPSRPNLTLSDLCFESIEETDVVITPDYVNQLYNYKNFVEEDESSLQQLDRQKMDMINPYLFGSNL